MKEMILYAVVLAGIWLTSMIYLFDGKVLEAIYWVLLGIFCMQARKPFN